MVNARARLGPPSAAPDPSVKKMVLQQFPPGFERPVGSEFWCSAKSQCCRLANSIQSCSSRLLVAEIDNATTAIAQFPDDRTIRVTSVVSFMWRSTSSRARHVRHPRHGELRVGQLSAVLAKGEDSNPQAWQA